MDLARIRKAIVAGILAWAGAIVAAAVEGGTPADAEGWLALIAGTAGLALATAWATYRVRNAGTVNGSDPQYDLGDVARGDVNYTRGQYPPAGDGQG
jgi:hypothetical protein